MKTYDTMFILPTDLDQPETDKVMESINEEIKRQDGELVETDVMGRRSFAHAMGKSHEGHYVRLRISMDPEKVSDFTRRLKLNGQIFRVQILVSDGRPFVKEAEPETPAEAPVKAPAKAPVKTPVKAPAETVAAAPEAKTDG